MILPRGLHCDMCVSGCLRSCRKQPHLVKVKHRPAGEGCTHAGVTGTQRILKDREGPLIQRLSLSDFPLCVRKRPNSRENGLEAVRNAGKT